MIKSFKQFLDESLKVENQYDYDIVSIPGGRWAIVSTPVTKPGTPTGGRWSKKSKQVGEPFSSLKDAKEYLNNLNGKK